MSHGIRLDTLLESAEEIIRNGKEYLSVALAQGWMKADKSYVTKLDYASETQLIGVVRDQWPEWAILAEEKFSTMPQAKKNISLDGLDGTAEYLAGRREWSISVGFIYEGKPVAGIVVQPALGRAFAVIRGEGVWTYNYDYEPGSGMEKWSLLQRVRAPRPTIGTDHGPNSPPGYLAEMDLLVKHFNTRSTNLPAVAGGIEVMLGSALCWWSYTAHHWDMAAVALMIEEISGENYNGVAECLGGSPIPWTSDTLLPPILLAESRKKAEEIRSLLFPDPVCLRKRA